MAKKKSSSAAAAAQKKRKHESPLTASAKDDTISTTTSKTKDPKQRRQKRKSKQALKDEAEERRLTAMLFGGATGDVDFHPHDSNHDDDNHQTNRTHENGQEDQDESPSLLFEIDRTGANEEEDGGPQEHEESHQEQYQQDPESEEDDSDDDDDSDNDDNNKPAWVDEDDDNVQVDLLRTDRLRKLRTSRGEDTKAKPLSGTELQQRLRTRYKTTMQVNAQTGWAKVDDEHDDNKNDEDDDDEATALQSSSQPLLLQGTSSGRLPPNILNVVRCPDANQADYNQAVVQAVQFHPGSDPNRPLLLTAGLDKTLRFFQVGSEKSEKIHGIHCE